MNIREMVKIIYGVVIVLTAFSILLPVWNYSMTYQDVSNVSTFYPYNTTYTPLLFFLVASIVTMAFLIANLYSISKEENKGELRLSVGFFLPIMTALMTPLMFCVLWGEAYDWVGHNPSSTWGTFVNGDVTYTSTPGAGWFLQILVATLIFANVLIIWIVQKGAKKVVSES